MDHAKTPPVSNDLANLCEKHLPHVSRTFAVTIPVLNQPLRDQVGLAYLLCRFADTIEDHPHLVEGDRNRWLAYVEEVLRQGQDREAPPLPWIPHPDSHYQALIQDAPLLLQAYEQLPENIRESVGECLLEMLAGMRSFPGRSDTTLVQVCKTLEQLDAYCHVVAGTVGILLTKLFTQRLGTAWATPGRLQQGQRFGLGLQVVNILKDRTGDQARGISYCPALPPYTSAGLSIPVLSNALGHLASGSAFIRAIPTEHQDLREFCIIPHRLALRTLCHLLELKEKISRSELGDILDQSQHMPQDELERLFREDNALIRDHCKNHLHPEIHPA